MRRKLLILGLLVLLLCASVIAWALLELPPPKYLLRYGLSPGCEPTGETKWIFRTVPQEGDFGVETWLNESWRYSGNANVWTMMSADEDLGYVYLPTSTPTSDYYGAFRLGDRTLPDDPTVVHIQAGDRPQRRHHVNPEPVPELL